MSFQFNKIIIIESLHTEKVIKNLGKENEDIPDKNTGLNLFNNLNDGKYSSINFEYKWINNKKELFKYLKNVAYNARSMNEYPIIHFECHGNKEGITLAYNDLISWEELSVKLIKINQAMKNNLIVTMACCKGIDLIRVFNKFERLSFNCAIGPLYYIYNSELEQAFLRFYRNFLETKILYDSFSKMFEKNDDENKYQFVSTETIFFKLKEELKKQYNSESRENHINNIKNKLKEKLEKDNKEINEKKFKEIINSELNDTINKIYHNRIEKFLFLDIYPEIKYRYKYLLSDIFEINS